MIDPPPGPQRLFPVEPVGDPLAVVAADPYRVVLRTDDLAAAAISAAGTTTHTNPVWITSPDRWHATVTRTGDRWRVDGTEHAPLDAIRRALTLINPKEI